MKYIWFLWEEFIPGWEDKANRHGGKWSIQLSKEKNRRHVNTLWLHTVRFSGLP